MKISPLASVRGAPATGGRPAACRRVLMTADAVGGVWSHALELGEGLRRHGVEVLLAVMGPKPNRAQRAEALARGIDVVHGQFRLEWMEEPWPDVDRAADWLLALESAFRPDVVHLNGYCHATLPWRAPVLVAGHSCIVSWWRASLGDDPPPRYDGYRRRVRDGLLAADAVVTPSRSMANALREGYGWTGGSVFVIPNGIPPLPLRRHKEDLVIAAGRLWDRGKNLGVLERVAPRVRWPIALAGPERHPGGARVRMRGVRVLGALPRPELVGWLARASILVHPVRYEPFGLVPLEAARAGCALVLADIESLREIWRGAATWVSPDDPEEIAWALERLIRAPDRRSAHALRARRRAARFGAAAMASAYALLYDGLARAAATCSRADPLVAGLPPLRLG